MTKSDIERISKLGYSVKEFAYFDGKFWRLRNVNGRCYFLTKDGLCKIYEDRPKGCRAYPIILIEGECKPDFEICPYADKLTISEVIYGCKLIREIYWETGGGI